MNVPSELEAVETRDGYDRVPPEQETAGCCWQPAAREQSIPRLVTALQDNNKHVRQAAAQALLGLGLMAWPDLLLVLMDAQYAGDQRLRHGANYVFDHSPIAMKITAPLRSKLQGLPGTTFAIMLEADRLYHRLLSNPTFAARVTTIRTREQATLRFAEKRESMDLPLDVAVECLDELGGHSRMVIVDPFQRQVTHLVVQETANRHVERMVPLELVRESTPAFIRLRCNRKELAQHRPFVDADYLHSILRYLDDRLGKYEIWPYFPTSEPGSVSPDQLRMPPGELSITRRTLVEAKDGHVGQVNEFMVNRQTRHITHLVLRAGYLWNQKNVTIPVGQIDHISDYAVFLSLDKYGIEALPAVPVPRWLF